MIIKINKDNPQQRLIKQIVKSIQDNKLLIIPTDSTLTLACNINTKNTINKIRQIRKFDKYQNLTLICHNLSQASTFAKINNYQFKQIKNNIPGPFTFILEANDKTPKYIQNEKRKTIGIRIPNHTITQNILKELNDPIVTASLIIDDTIYTEIQQIKPLLFNQIDLIIDSNENLDDVTTIIELINDVKIIRQSKFLPNI